MKVLIIFGVVLATQGLFVLAWMWIKQRWKRPLTFKMQGVEVIMPRAAKLNICPGADGASGNKYFTWCPIKSDHSWGDVEIDAR
jgi:hypothetical protein